MGQAALLDRVDELVHYPQSDGKPLADTDLHRNEILGIIQTLDHRYADQGDVYVSGDLLIYYEEGDPSKCRAPDVFAALGVEKKLRRTYLLWEEKQAPTLAIEVTSKKTHSRDEKQKRDLYARLGIDYYVVYDPEARYAKPPLQVNRRTGNDYVRMAASSGIFPCPPLDLAISLDAKGLLQLTDLRTGEVIPRLPVALKMAEEAREQEAGARRRAEERAQALQEELERLRTQLRNQH